ncbi:MAG: hypothetical protein OIF50_04640 [Flavobacteriaceae bacterium]|nr:hypothetical protein [Flavobacteriaceae bacterium]
MKKSWYLLWFCSCAVLFGQDAGGTSTFDKEAYVQRLVQAVKFYPKQPMYYLRIGQHNCTYEILVNDKPVTENFSLDVMASASEINRAILKTGWQTLTYRLYPIEDLIQKAYGEGEFIKTLLGNTSITIDITRIDDLITYQSMSEERTIQTHTSAIDPKTKLFVGNGKPYYEHTFTFYARVPYEIEGWSHAIDLRKLDRKKLRAAVHQKYLEIQKWYEQEDAAKIMEQNYHVIERLVHSEYRDEKYIREVVDDYMASIFRPNKRFQPLKDYKMVFYNDGKSVLLWHPSLIEKPDLDKRLANNAALYYLHTKPNGNIRVQFLGIFLSISKDKHQKGAFHLEYTR